MGQCQTMSGTDTTIGYSLNLASAVLSVIGSSITIIALIINHQTKPLQPLSKLILWLSVSDLGASLGIAISQTLLFIPSATLYSIFIMSSITICNSIFFLHHLFYGHLV